jgi:hypothetical protein
LSRNSTWIHPSDCENLIRSQETVYILVISCPLDPSGI